MSPIDRFHQHHHICSNGSLRGAYCCNNPPPFRPRYCRLIISIIITSILSSNALLIPANLPQLNPALVLVSERGGCNISHYDENMISNPLYSYTNSTQTSNSSYLATNIMNNMTSHILSASIGIDCQHITAEQLHEQFNRLRPYDYLKVVVLSVKDSNLTTLSNLPQGSHELKKMIISNTSIDLEVLKEGSEALNQLNTLEITNERISNIPRNFFQEMQSLKELKLENDEIASLDGDAFHNLDDSLELLDLRRNRFNRFPMAVKNLAQLAMLDLSDNDIVIDTQDYDLPEKLEPLLNLRVLAMNRINCTCEFSSSPFFEWIARTHIYGVRCFSPEKLKCQEVIVFERDEFCPRSSANRVTNFELGLSSHLILLILCQIGLMNHLMYKCNTSLSSKLTE